MVEIPLWLLVLIVLFAAVTFASHFLFPSVRWFFRKRAERLISRMNERLTRPIQPFKLARRHDQIQRLIYDPAVAQAVVDYAAEKRVPENVAFEKARDYAREIVPSFSATAYFTIGTRLARWLTNSLYRVRLADFDRGALDEIDPEAAVIFVMNHKSNMDYVLVTYLVSQASALSYAVGEWARVWPLSSVIRAMGAYFIRRNNRSALYRRVLARYVQMSVQGGVTQAFFPEGGLSLDGRLGPPKLGLLSYIVDGWEPEGRDVIFVPVALNYDHVLEDRYLVAAKQAGVRRFRPPFSDIVGGLIGHLWARLTFRFNTFGTASVGFGRPVSLAALQAQGPVEVDRVGALLMGEVAQAMPAVPVGLVAEVMRDGAARTEAEVLAAVEALVARIGANAPRRAPKTFVPEALARMRRRRLIKREGDLWGLVPERADIVEFYAASLDPAAEEEGAAQR